MNIQTLIDEKRANVQTLMCLWIYGRLLDGLRSPNALVSAMDGTLFRRFNELRQAEIDWTTLYELANTTGFLEALAALPAEKVTAYAYREVDKYPEVLAYIQSQVGISTGYDKFRDDTLALRLWRLYCLIDEAQRDNRKNTTWVVLARWMEVGAKTIENYIDRLRELKLIESERTVIPSNEYYGKPRREYTVPAISISILAYRLLPAPVSYGAP